MTRELSERMTAAVFIANRGGNKPAKQAKVSKLEESLAEQMTFARLPKFERQFKFLQDRRFLFDFAFVPQKLAIEVQGGYYSNGRHNRDPIGDCKKANLAGQHGWQVIFLKPDEVRDGSGLTQIEKALKEKP